MKMCFLTPLAIATASFLLAGRIQGETAYFLMSGPVPPPSEFVVFESYVVAVTDEALIQQARDHLRGGVSVPPLIPHVRIAAGADAANLNYAEPGHPPWSWHVTELIEWTTPPEGPILAVVIPNRDGAPSFVPLLLTGDATNPPVDDMALIRFPLAMELSPSEASIVANVSTRGSVLTGEGVLIAGFIVQGGTPRNVLVRGIGPSLTQHGVNEPLANPKITVYWGPEKIAENDDWQDGNLVPPGFAPDVVPWYGWLLPGDPKEAAFKLSLLPGAYTVHVSGVGDTTGIALAEVYDLDALRPE